MKRFITKRIKPILQNVIDSGGDIVDSLVARRGGLIAPRKLRRIVGPTDARLHRAIGEMYLQCSTNLCNLMPNEAVLDVGCGCGRVAAPLTRYLDKSSKYEGFDIVPSVIRWCIDNISSRYPNFHFRLADVFNNRYNPHGQCEASKYRFPYPNESFDFAVATSVFTHMLPPDMENYLSEIARTLRSGGRYLVTLFLLNKESLELVNAKRSAYDFKYEFGQYRSIDSNCPEAFVCYDEAFVLGLYEKYRLKVKRAIRYGAWSWFAKAYSIFPFIPSQDIVVAYKE
jgi:SAM-dependent methyltransferase